MTLSLYLLRHAKAEREGASDFERALARRGHREAEAVGRFLARIDETPGLVLSSEAARARETAELAHAAGGWRAPIVTRPEIYQGSEQALLRVLTTVEASVGRLVLVGHQPALSLLIAGLCAGCEPAFPAAALARVDLERNRWNEVAARAGKLHWLVTPALIEALDETE